MTEELTKTKEALVRCTQEISLLSAENVRLRARLEQFSKLDPDRIIAIVSEVTAQLKQSEARIEGLTKALGEQNQRNKNLEAYIEHQAELLEDLQGQLETSKKGIFGALDIATTASAAESEHQERMDNLKDKLLDLTSAVKSVTERVLHLEPPASYQLPPAEQDKIHESDEAIKNILAQF